MFALAPFPVVYVVPKVQAHLSAFSAPRRSYHAFRSGSEIASSISCAMMLAMPSAPAFPLGPVLWSAQEVGQRSGLPTNEYLMSAPPTEAWSCQPQYCEQKPDEAVTSDEVSTKYSAFVSFGNLPPLIALVTTDRIRGSLSQVPCE